MSFWQYLFNENLIDNNLSDEVRFLLWIYIIVIKFSTALTWLQTATLDFISVASLLQVINYLAENLSDGNLRTFFFFYFSNNPI